VSGRRQVAVVTGGGGGIGAAVAEELGRAGWFVVTLDPMVTLDGSAQLPEPTETTADRIVAAGGAARASFASVTDGEALRALFAELAEEHGGLDAVVNVAGITRQSGFAHGTEEDWLAVATVHLDGYLNILRAALPVMAATGHGHVLGVTSGSGWRAADAGAYSAAKRVVASLTWQLGPLVPAGVTVNAVSPIAATRMVAAALERARQMGRTGGGGGLSLLGMPGPEDLAPLAGYLVSDDFAWCSGRVVFAGGSEMAMVDEPRLVEVVRSDAGSLDHVLATVIPRALAKAETTQTTGGGSNPRFGSLFGDPAGAGAPAPEGPAVRTCLVVSDRPGLGDAVTAALAERSVTCHRAEVARGFDKAADALRAADDAMGPIDAVVLAPARREPAGSAASGWERVLAEHEGIVEDLHTDAGWARAVADYAAASSRSVTLVTASDATSAGGRSRAQAAAQLARVGAATTEGRVSAFAVSLEAPDTAAAGPAAALVAHLVTNPEAAPLAGAELAVGEGWIGLRAHPRPVGSVVYGGPAIPRWLDARLREMAGAPEASGAAR
jgi:NAD(P)-dependent dehydrogenase (short-subunit alcohol dehydrogenase family)